MKKRITQRAVAGLLVVLALAFTAGATSAFVGAKPFYLDAPLRFDYVPSGAGGQANPSDGPGRQLRPNRSRIPIRPSRLRCKTAEMPNTPFQSRSAQRSPAQPTSPTPKR